MDANLASYVRTGSAEAFRKVVEGHVDFVYSVAVRQTRDRALAEDVTQAVFATLARKAGSLSDGVALGGWLFRTTFNESRNAVRLVARRRRHEREAAAMRSEITEEGGGDEGWRAVEPELNEAIRSLGTKDRAALLMRFFEGRTARQVGEAMAISEDAARQRIGRAVARLRAALQSRGVTVAPAALAAGLERHAVVQAPEALAGQAAAHAIEALSAAKGTVLGFPVGKMAGLAAGVVVAAGTVGIVVVTELAGGRSEAVAATTTNAVGAAAGPASRAAVVPVDDSAFETPLKTVATLADAIERNRTDVVRACLVSERPNSLEVVMLSIAMSSAAARVDRTARAAFDDVPHFQSWGYRSIEGIDGGVGELLGRVAAQADPAANVTVNGETATVTMPAGVFVDTKGQPIDGGRWKRAKLQFRRVDGRWRVDVDRSFDVGYRVVPVNKKEPLSADEALPIVVKFETEFNTMLARFADELQAVGFSDLRAAEAELQKQCFKLFTQNKVGTITLHVTPR